MIPTVTGSPADRVLAVDDGQAIRRALTLALEARGYDVTVAGTGRQALELCASRQPAAVLLDLGLPDIDGVDVVRRLRAAHGAELPIIVLTALGADEQKLTALDEGADDYLTKPYSTPELLARLQLALDHRRPGEAAGVGSPVVAGGTDHRHVGDLMVDAATQTVIVGGRNVSLTDEELAFLTLLARRPARIRTHRAILHAMLGPGHDRDTQYLRARASQLRQKLRDDPAHPRLITEPGVGYRLVDPDRVREPARW